MMRYPPTPLPLAFVLAMSVDASGTTLPAAGETGEPLRPGQLAPLVEQGSVPAAPVDILGEGVAPETGQRTVQIFPNFPNTFANFRNCFSGSFRNC